MFRKDNRWASDRTLGVLTCLCLVMAPFTLGLSLLALFGVFCLSMMERQAFERNTILSEAIATSSLYRLHPEEEEILEEFHDSYILPSECPNCRCRVCLTEVEWIDNNTAICPECGAYIKTLLI